MNQIGAKLRSLRKYRGLTQQQVAGRLGITVRAYQHYETGDRTPNLEKSFHLAEILGITVDELSSRILHQNVTASK